jgi:hypothetical protein
MRYILTIIFLTIAVNSGSAVEQIQLRPNESLVVGAGAMTCGKFAEDYRANPSRAEEFYTSWLLGFLNGLNTMSVANGLQLHELSPAIIEPAQAFVRSYCNEHPLALYIYAATQYAATLPIRP